MSIQYSNYRLTQQATLLKKRWYHFLKPVHWPMWIALFAMWACSKLPYRVMLKLGTWFGLLGMKILAKRRHIAAVNLRLCFPELSEQKREALLRRSFASVGIGLLETGLAWWGSDQRLRRLVKHGDFASVHQAHRQGKGVLIFTGHFTTIELGMRLTSFYIPINIMYRAQKNTLFEWMLQQRRGRYITQSILREDVRGMFKALRRNQIVCYASDQDYGPKVSVFAPFFGVPAATVTAMSKFVRRTKTPIVPAFYFRENNKYVIEMQPIVEDFPSDNDLVDTTRTNGILEHAIRRCPEQYLWQHRRFKTRPPGEAYPY
ncbi:MAG: LpxL/LpxP family Kdo(2)-lipid IV(A) lauroyl/palmitoleoyl acyltransferase [Gammaproteobacteria bacterium]|nr:LpxL/LpxP family Kdo(2)-lipid IV(A) lauroyl/palmitoleoyl acyltransferase [Gammaproteobacteria bacterium]